MTDYSFYLNTAKACTDQDTLIISVPIYDAENIIEYLNINGFPSFYPLIEDVGFHQRLIEITLNVPDSGQ